MKGVGCYKRRSIWPRPDYSSEPNRTNTQARPVP